MRVRPSYVVALVLAVFYYAAIRADEPAKVSAVAPECWTRVSADRRTVTSRDNPACYWSAPRHRIVQGWR
jgi:hypothetical protein